MYSSIELARISSYSDFARVIEILLLVLAVKKADCLPSVNMSLNISDSQLFYYKT